MNSPAVYRGNYPAGPVGDRFDIVTRARSRTTVFAPARVHMKLAKPIYVSTPATLKSRTCTKT